MPQGFLPFKYLEEKKLTHMTALAGLPPYLELAFIAGMSDSIEKNLKIRSDSQGWTDTEQILALVMLNIAGGNCVDDLRIIEGDKGFTEILHKAQSHNKRRREREAMQKRWRREKTRGVPSPSAAFEYLRTFHNPGEEKKREACKAFIPSPNQHFQGLAQITTDFINFTQSRKPMTTATLDTDATLIETCKEEALYCYKGFKSYQPFNVYWAEHDLVVYSEFRDGNVPAGSGQLRVFKETLARMPASVKKIYTRSDTAGYQHDFLKFCAEGKDERFGVIEFAVGADVTSEFKKAVAEVPEQEWHPLLRRAGGKFLSTGQEWAEVGYVPSWVGHVKKSPDYRFLAIREPLRQLVLPGMDKQLTFPFPTMDFKSKGKYKMFGVVTNRTIPGDELIWWHRERCGKSEEAHSTMKSDLAGGKLPSGLFGVNAAWWAIMILAYNLNSAMKRLVLGENWVSKRMKAIRFGLINLPGRIIHRSREMIVSLTGGHTSNEILLQMRSRILSLSHDSFG
jgi:hypothetical protein